MGKAISVKIDLGGIEKKLSSQSLQIGKAAMMNQMMLDTNKYIPKKSGNLRASGRVVGNSIVYNPPYARAQYYGPKRKGFVSEKQRRFFFANKEELLAAKRKYTTPGTGTHWYEKSFKNANNIRNWKKVFIKAIDIDAT
ncbi:TPA: minor capsid protein [Streptococcus suis]